jgi:hypothetical protein
LSRGLVDFSIGFPTDRATILFLFLYENLLYYYIT